MFDLKVINAVLSQLEEERGIPKEKIIDAIETALGTAYKKEYGKKGQIIKAKFDLNSGDVEFWQSKIVVDENSVIMDGETESPDAYSPIEISKEDVTPKSLTKSDDKDEALNSTNAESGEEIKIRYNPEHHILIDEAKLIKKDVELGEELTFPLDKKDDFGRIAAQTAKQVITQKIREAEKTSVMSEFGEKEGEIVSGTVERMERGSVYLDMGRAVGMLAYEEQIPGERFKQGERVRAYLFRVDETPKGIFLKLSRSHPRFLEQLFESEVPEVATGSVEIKSIAREAGSRSKVAVFSEDDHIDPVGALVGQRGVRVSTIMSELGGEKIDVIEWSENASEFISEALSPAKISNIETDEDEKIAKVTVNEDQQSLAIGKGGQNVRLAAKLTGWKIDIISTGGDEAEEAPAETEELVSSKVEPLDSADAEPGKEEIPKETKSEDSAGEKIEETPAEEKTEE